MTAAMVDVVVCPGVGVPPFPWRQLYPREVDGNAVDNYMAWLTLTAAWTVVGQPVVALPAGTDAGGLPFGIQVVGHRYRDRGLLSAARALESAWDGTEFARPRPDFEALAATDVDLGPDSTAAMF